MPDGAYTAKDCLEGADEDIPLQVRATVAWQATTIGVVGLVVGILAVIVLAAVILGYSSIFTVYQTQQALVVRLGQPIGIDDVSRTAGQQPC